jgi:prevent-host-death family protein
MAERTVSATEARVHFGELLDGVTKRNDVVFVERAGGAAAVVVSIQEWQRRCQGENNPWAGIAEKMEAHWSYMREKYGDSLDRDAVDEILRIAREDRDARPF